MDNNSDFGNLVPLDKPTGRFDVDDCVFFQKMVLTVNNETGH